MTRRIIEGAVTHARINRRIRGELKASHGVSVKDGGLLAVCSPPDSLCKFAERRTHISSTDKLFGLQKAFGEITYLSFHKDAISVWGVMGATNLIV